MTGCAIPFKDKEKAMERKKNKGCKQKGIVERVTKEYEVTRCKAVPAKMFEKNTISIYRICAT